jgi:hypothetical protein
VIELSGPSLPAVQIQDEPPKAEPAPQPPVDVDVEVAETPSDATLGVSPIWLAIGGLALLVLIVLIVMSVRGRETTVVRQ